MRTNAERAGLTHLSDTDLDICECDDVHCACSGDCREKAVYTMYEQDEQGNDTEISARMCADCAGAAWENGTHQSDENKGPNHYDNEFPTYYDAQGNEHAEF